MPQRSAPEPTVGFLVNEVARLIRRNFNHRARNRGLTQAQWQTLAVLYRHEGVNQATLAERIEIHPATLTKVIDRLAAAGWVERRPDPSDRRAFLLHLTEAAEPLIDEMRGLAAEVRDQALASVPEAARRQLLDTLLTMKANLQPCETDAFRDQRDRADAEQG
ncbi:DNA-binding transcriptional regulator, MarR family [Tistlia consotensis]|uniref:DNA-binding transcriptional regulator, MarR family n=1 Tax=Tistlia consotensis USBA 355 TaxID=560819 RepID=A0A1Y6BB07_9PROT|nr:MarR family transcriptional regulator [Tistlia consotensis]SMF02205.1 DNA-binding transcriptional regulator, MarR family [Tistlia consotensis USBA 355]SNS26462.1 DNA-binding transcriptional regulator, MarR family [Tistlia consotensis]